MKDLQLDEPNLNGHKDLNLDPVREISQEYQLYHHYANESDNKVSIESVRKDGEVKSEAQDAEFKSEKKKYSENQSGKTKSEEGRIPSEILRDEKMDNSERSLENCSDSDVPPNPGINTVSINFILQ